VFCRQQVADLALNAGRFQEKNADLVVIGSGDPRHFPEFREKTGYDGLLFSDPSLKTFSMLNFSNGLMGFMSIGSVVKAASALKQGHRQGSIQGSTLQLGGAVIIDSSGAMRYYFAGSKAGDHPSVADLVKGIDQEPVF
jgi:peroxiredoxin